MILDTLPIYQIVRYYLPDTRISRISRVMCTNLTLSEAQSHCRNPETRQYNQYFDGYDVMPKYRRIANKAIEQEQSNELKELTIG